MNYQSLSTPPATPTPTIITDIDIPFGRMVMIILKFVLASIPAYLILLVIFLLGAAILGGFATAFHH